MSVRKDSDYKTELMLVREREGGPCILVAAWDLTLLWFNFGYSTWFNSSYFVFAYSVS